MCFNVTVAREVLTLVLVSVNLLLVFLNVPFCELTVIATKFKVSQL